MQWRDGLLVVLGLLLGPPVAALVMLLGMSMTRHGVEAVALFDVEFYTGTLLFAYILAWFPMLIVGVANALVSRWVREPLRLLLALPIGAAPFAFQLGWLAESEEGVTLPGELLSVALGGAIASLVCVALVEAFGPKLQRPQ